LGNVTHGGLLVIYKQIGLILKVQKHLQNQNWSKAAMYFAALLQRDGRPTEGAPLAIITELKALGFKFKASPCGDVAAVTPDGVIYSGKEVLAAWNAA